MSKAPLTEATPLKGGEESAGPKKWHSFFDGHQWKVVGVVALLVAIATTKTQITAFLFSYSSVPTAYSWWSCVITDVMLLPIFIAEWCGCTCMGKQWGIPTWTALPTFGLICFFTLFDLMMTNIALAEIPSAVQACIAATNPFWALLIESLLYCKLQNILIYAAVCVIVIGAVLTSLGEVDYLTAWGVIAAFIAVISSASKYVFTHKQFKEANQGPDKLSAFALLFWVDLVLLPIYATIAGAQGELKTMFVDATASVSIFFQFTGTAGLGGVRALTQYFVLTLLSATSLATASTFTTALNIFISMTWQEMDISATLISGSCLVIVAAACYAYFKIAPDSLLLQWTSWTRIRGCLGMPLKEEPGAQQP